MAVQVLAMYQLPIGLHLVLTNFLLQIFPLYNFTNSCNSWSLPIMTPHKNPLTNQTSITIHQHDRLASLEVIVSQDLV